MSERGDIYRRKAKDMFAKAAESDDFREEYQNLAMSFLCLAAQADRNSQTNLPEPDVPFVQEGQRDQFQQQQQQQRSAPTSETDDK